MYCMIISGMPCSGKSTIAKLYSKLYGCEYISSGDIARKMAEDDSDVFTALQNGAFAPEKRMRDAIADRISLCTSNKTSFILDGFPRFDDQDRFLNTVLAICDVRKIYVLVDVDKETCIKRAEHRNRFDDKAIEDRIDYFNESTLPVFKAHQPIIIENRHGADNNDIVDLLHAYITLRTHRDIIVNSL